MLVNYNIENFRSYFEEAKCNFIKGKEQNLNESIIKATADKEYKLLPLKIIYGVNASGKSNFIKSLQVLKKILLNGSIKSDISGMYDILINNISSCHFVHSYTKFKKPIKFNISFIENGKLFNYILHLGLFDLGNDFDSVVTYEELNINNCCIFKRKDNDFVFNPDDNKEFKKYITNDMSFVKSLQEILNSSERKYDVFTKWFDTSKDLIEEIKNWFNNGLRLYDRIDKQVKYLANANNDNDVSDKSTAVLNDLLFDLVKEADFGPQEIRFELDKNMENKNILVLNSIYQMKGKKDFGMKINSNISESLGTLNLIYFIGPFINSIINGSTLIIDELDSSLHPEIIASIINVYKDPRVNIKGAQLIFTTHNPVFLNKNLVRRDEILFVEKDNKTYESTITSLDEFEDRSDHVYLKNYLNGRYINFVDIDFSKIIKKAMEGIASNYEEKN